MKERGKGDSPFNRDHPLFSRSWGSQVKNPSDPIDQNPSEINIIHPSNSIIKLTPSPKNRRASDYQRKVYPLATNSQRCNLNRIKFDKFQPKNELDIEDTSLKLLSANPFYQKLCASYKSQNLSPSTRTVKFFENLKNIEINKKEDTDPFVLVDAYYYGSTEVLLRQADNWDFNIFFFDQICGGKSFIMLALHLFDFYGFWHTFNLDAINVYRFLNIVSDNYIESNPYHNALHAADVAQALHCLIQEAKWNNSLKIEDIFSVLIAALCHDLNHPALNQNFLISTQDLIALLQKEDPILENHHWNMTYSLLLQTKLLNHLNTELRNNIYGQIKSFILATDITCQQRFLTEFQTRLNSGNHIEMCPNHNNLNNLPSSPPPLLQPEIESEEVGCKPRKTSFDLSVPKDRHFLLQIALKCSDISNPARQWVISQRWSRLICRELFNQGDAEKLLNIPLTTICDRTRTSLAQIQDGFLEYIVYPMYAEWHKFVQSPLSSNIIANIISNQTRWRTILKELENSRLIPIIPEEEYEETPVTNNTSGAPRSSVSYNSNPSISNAELMAQYENLDVKLMIWRRYSVPISLPKVMNDVSLSRRKSYPRSQHVKWHIIFQDELQPLRKKMLELSRRFTLGEILIDSMPSSSFDTKPRFSIPLASGKYSVFANPNLTASIMCKVNKLVRQQTLEELKIRKLSSPLSRVASLEAQNIDKKPTVRRRLSSICLDDSISNPNNSTFSSINRNLSMIYLAKKQKNRQASGVPYFTNTLQTPLKCNDSIPTPNI